VREEHRLRFDPRVFVTRVKQIIGYVSPHTVAPLTCHALTRRVRPPMTSGHGGRRPSATSPLGAHHGGRVPEPPVHPRPAEAAPTGGQQRRAHLPNGSQVRSWAEPPPRRTSSGRSPPALTAPNLVPRLILIVNSRGVTEWAIQHFPNVCWRSCLTTRCVVRMLLRVVENEHVAMSGNVDTCSSGNALHERAGHRPL
jgi:hypothetical protein